MLALLLLLTTLAPWSWAKDLYPTADDLLKHYHQPRLASMGSGVDSIYFVVPAYREFYNGNLSDLLESISKQENLLGLKLPDIHIVVVVNNTQGASDDVKLENRETVEFLKSLQRKQMPSLRKEDIHIQKAAKAVLQSPVQIHVLDYTTPGLPTRNIGKVRDLGNQWVLNQVDRSKLNRVVIAQMDADTTVNPDFISKTQAIFSYTDFDFALGTLQYAYERDSDPDIFRRAITQQAEIAAYHFHLANIGEQPISGSPRIFARASAIEAIGGVPHLTHAEDMELVKRLKERFPERGAFPATLDVLTRYRGRDDGYDAAFYNEHKHLPAELSDFVKQRVQDLSEFEKFLTTQSPAIQQLYKNEVDTALNQLHAKRGILVKGIEEDLNLLHKRKSLKKRFDHPFFQTSWYENYLNATLRTFSSPHEAYLKIERDFPHLIQGRIEPDNQLVARFNAAFRVK